MKRLIEQKYVFQQNMIVVIGVCLSFYFCYHLIAGERSYLRYLSLNSRIADVETDLHKEAADRESLEDKVRMMRPGSVNRDLLEEQARRVLGFQYEGEKVLIRSSD